MARRLVLLLSGLVLLGFAAEATRKGSIEMRGVTASRAEEPLRFWGSVALLAASGGLFLAFALFGRF